ncbi:MAG: riboflavin synthase subunit alpha [Candidatus Schekmanbacteria bacterium RBG_13_48_7]|uniref:Riboflavin synthase n=1 Tax=Candidatus Schekmanbacteria bacterium RBG_13_48_7 TaxID=1817878 RepID=A0A1F7RUX6_9BACT|nr:MAG: riboflavin synthase subunit alpha [Candidatus Schekmanbacteria bacterium RBG_13_48_7]
MFTGIVEEIGKVSMLQQNRDPALMEIEAVVVIKSLKQGDSISVNGVCLTVVMKTEHKFQVEVSQESFDRSNLGDLKRDDPVNLERALSVSDRLGGHLVLGHIDGKSKITDISKKSGNMIITFSVPLELSRYIVDKGSVTIDGISLTPFNKTDSNFSVSVIPHTMNNTILKKRRIGDHVNIEVDILAKYLESLIVDKQTSKKSIIDKEFLNRYGFT